MTPAVLDRPGFVTERPLLGGGSTLEELLSATLRAARTNGSAECPVCHSRMTFTREGAAEASHGAECGSCGSRLS